MFKIVTKTLTKQDNLKELVADLEAIRNEAVYIGIPSTKKDRESGAPINNAELAYIHEHGAPLHGVPQREFLQPAINHDIAKINFQQQKILEAGLNGDIPQMKVEMNKLGLLGQSLVKNWFANPNNGWEPLKPATVKKKKSSRPLVDTAQLLNSITYIIRGNT